jgi:hypothetical protein
MQAKPEPRVEASEDGASFTLTLGAWSGTHPLDALPRQLQFYRQLRDRKNGAYAEHYAPTVRALETFARHHDLQKR